MELIRSASLATALVVATALLGAGAPPTDGATPPAKGATPPVKGTTPPAKGTTPPASADTPPAKKPVPPLPKSDVILHCKPQTGLPREKFTFFGQEWDCELCLDDISRSTGMGAREEFPAGTAMIFVHPRASLLSFWMKDCLVDMDMVFVDSEGKISAMHEAKKQTLRSRSQTLDGYEGTLVRYSSNRRAQFVIEVPAGTIARVKPQLGQVVAIDWKALVARAK